MCRYRRHLKSWLGILFTCLLAPLSAVTINLNDYNEWNILQLVEQLIPRNPIIVQAGGHQGDQMLQMVDRWPIGRIYSFEPNPQFFSILKNRASYCPQVTVFPLALDAQTRSAPFYVSASKINPRMGSLLKSTPQWEWYYCDSSAIDVNCINLEEWAQNHVRSIDFLWLDIGGVELRVLQSLSYLFSTLRVILLETYFQEFREGTGTYTEIKNFLIQHDFEEIQHWHVPHFQGYAVFAKRGLAEIAK